MSDDPRDVLYSSLGKWRDKSNGILNCDKCIEHYNELLQCILINWSREMQSNVIVEAHNKAFLNEQLPKVITKTIKEYSDSRKITKPEER